MDNIIIFVQNIYKNTGQYEVKTFRFLDRILLVSVLNLKVKINNLFQLNGFEQVGIIKIEFSKK